MESPITPVGQKPQSIRKGRNARKRKKYIGPLRNTMETEENPPDKGVKDIRKGQSLGPVRIQSE